MRVNDPIEILNWSRLSDAITTSGQPTEAQLAAIRDLGVVEVVNLGLHTHEKALADEAATVVGLGMTYTHIPVDFSNPVEADYQRFCDVMAAVGERTVHVHCIVNARVTAFFYRYQTEVLGIGEAKARAMMEKVWRPGRVWAAFIGDDGAANREHQYARRDY
jgi:protein tyrosine phosphatase (PTP) superfamily phosphohydrolase (DUF442 family)